MKKFMNKSTLALLLTLLMLLSAITVGASLFAASAEETPAYEATATIPENKDKFFANGTKVITGTFVEVVTATNALSDSTLVTIELHKDVELSAPIQFTIGRVGTINGNGHTIHFASTAMSASTTALITFGTQGGKNGNSMYFQNLNFSGQGKDWKLGDTPATFGTAKTGGAAFSLHPYQKVYFTDCRIENFYSYNTASVFYYTAINIEKDTRGLFLENTVITNNHALGDAAGNSAAVMRTRNGGGSFETDNTHFNAQVYVSGNTYIYDNYDKNGAQANLNLLRAQDIQGHSAADNRLYVAANFTGKVGLVGKDFLAKEQTNTTLPVSIFFQGTASGNGDLDARVGKVVCVTGSTTHYAVPSTTADANGNYPVASINQCAGIRYKLSGETAWTYSTNANIGEAIKKATGGDSADDNVIELLTDVTLQNNNSISSAVYVTINGNGHTINSTSHGATAPQLTFGNSATRVVFNDVKVDGGVTVTKGEDGVLSFTGATYTGQQGAFFRAYAAGAEVTLNNVEIRNFFMTRSDSSTQIGAAALAFNGGIVRMNNVYVHDNYTIGGAAIGTNDNSKIYLDGECTFENNYTTIKNVNGDVVTYTIDGNADIMSSGVASINISKDFVTDSIIVNKSAVSNAIAFATLTDGELNENANIINGADADMTFKVVNGTLKWSYPTEIVTVTVTAKNGNEIFSYETELAAGDPLPSWNGVIWNGDDALKTHVAGTKTYTATWAEDAATIALYKYYGDTEYSIATSGSGLQSIIIGATAGTEASDNVIELIDNVTIPGKLQRGTADFHFTLRGNGYVISDSASYQEGGVPMFGLSGATSKVVFENVILDGGANATVDPATGVITVSKKYGGGAGAAIRTYEAGVELTMTDVEIRNFAQLRTNNSSSGSAVYVLSGSKVWLHNVNIHDNYSSGTGAAISHSDGSAAELHLSGNCTFNNNWNAYYDATTGNYSITDKADIYYTKSIPVLYIADDFTAASFIFKSDSRSDAAGETFANLEAGATLNAGANFICFANKDLIVDTIGSTLVWAVPGAEDVTVTVMSKDGTTEILSYETSFLSGAELPTWSGAIWNGDAALKTHVAGTTAYVVTWAEDSTVVAFATRNNGDTWEVTDNLNNFTNYSYYTNIEVIGDLVLASSFNICNNAKYVLDFNNFTVTRSSLGVRLQVVSSTVASEGYPEDKSPRNAVIKNAKFDGKINGQRQQTQGANEFVYIGYGSYGATFDNCEFFDFWGDQGSVFRAMQPSSFTLKDVYMHDNVAASNAGAIRAHTGGTGTMDFVRVYLAGNTRIYTDSSKGATVESRNILFNVAAIAIVDDFCGNVQVTGGVPVALGGKLAPSTLLDWAYVAEGAVVTGTITNLSNSYVAAGVNGDLIWVQKGAELPGASFKVDENDKLKVYTTPWYYNNGEENVRTTTVVEGFYNYFGGGDYVLDETVEAYIVGKIAGDLKTVAKSVADGDVVEIVKSVKVHGVSFGANVTINGNNMTLTITPEAEGGNDHMILITKNATINDLNFFGGAQTAGKWEGPIAPQDMALLFANSGNSYVYLNNCTFTGHRVVTKNDHGSAIYNSSSKMFFTDCTIVDNFARSTPKEDGSRSLSTARPALRAMNEGCVSFYGKCVVKDNYGVWSDDSAVASKGIQTVSFERLYLGQLTEGSDIVLGSNYGYITGLDANGRPFNNSGYISVGDGNQSFALDAIPASEPRIFTVVYVVGYAPASEQNAAYGAKNGEFGALTYPINTSAVGIEGSEATGGAQITEDKLMLTVYVPYMADFNKTNVVVKLGNKTISKTPLSAFPATQTAYARNNLEIPVVVGMAELTKDIVVELQNLDGSLIDDYKISAKYYADTLIAMADADLIECGVLEDSIIPMKSAMAALLQYGQMVQNYFDVDAPVAMTDQDVNLWEDLGLTLEMVATSTLYTSGANDSVKASAGGTLPAGVTVMGATLTMENEISLRIYFAAASLDGIAFTVDGAAAEVKAANSKYGSNVYYIEKAHIGTQNLANGVVFGIGSYTYTASPMTYVYTVNEAAESNTITAELKDACAALYYYYSAVSKYFGLDFDTTGFSTSDMLRVMNDVANAFSAPRFIKVA